MLLRSAVLTFFLFAGLTVHRARTVDSNPCGACEPSLCESVRSLRQRCAGGSVVSDTCGCCSQCGRLQGQVCGGTYGYLGICDRSLVCTANEVSFMLGRNISGVCTRKVCRKNCTTFSKSPRCGSDGRMYRNICELRQFKHCLGRDVSAVKDFSICNGACPELLSPAHGNVSYSAGLVPGSVATLSCRAPYILQRGGHRTCQSNRTWNGAITVCARLPDPCLNHVCTNYTVCTTDSRWQAQCVCRDTSECMGQPGPVCAINGITYPSECHMKAWACERCQQNPSQCLLDLFITSYGKCANNGQKRRRR